MGVNKVIYYGEVLVDMSQVTVTPETLSKGVTALDAKGDLIAGLHECKETEPKLQSKTVTPTTSLQTVNPDSGYDGLSKVTVNAMPTATQATPSITVSTGGLITAKSTQSAGYVASGTKQATKQLTVQAAQTITPGTSDKTIASGRYLTGTQTIKGDANLVADNIKSGVSIFGVAGSYEGSGGGSGGIQHEVVTIPAGSNSVAYTLPRVTHAVGSANLELGSVSSRNYENFVSGIRNNDAYRASDFAPGSAMCSIDFDSTPVTYSNGTLTIPRVSDGVMFDVMVLLVNDPDAPAISG